MSFSPANRLANSIEGATTYTFDNAGNKVLEKANGALTSFSFSPENRLSLRSSATGLSTYSYQGYNGLRRVAVEPGVSPTTFVWDGSDYLGQY